MSSYRRRTSPRRSRSLSYKKKVIKSVHTIGLSKTLRKLNVTKDQVKSWLTKEEEIMQSSREVPAPQSARVLYAALQQEEQVLLQWIMEKRRAREMVYSDEVIEKAGRLFAQVGEEHKGKANRRWLGSFKKRFKLHGEVGDRPRPVQVLSAPKPLPVSAFRRNYQPLTPEISATIDFFHRDTGPIIMDLEASPASILEVIDLASTP